VLIEKHFTLRRADGGVDAAFSLEPAELAALVTEAHRAWQALGEISYGATAAERPSLKFRRSLYVAQDLKAGDTLTAGKRARGASRHGPAAEAPRGRPRAQGARGRPPRHAAHLGRPRITNGEYMAARKHQYDVFLAGELVDLVVPDEHAITVDGWYAWFNDQALTRNMEQGMYPNSPAQQLKFLEELRTSKTRLGLLIKPKREERVVGIVSLSKVSHVTRQADVGMIIARRVSDFRGAFAGMEAKCLITEHAFDTLGLERINSYQSAALKDWQRWQVLFGYRMEGIQRKASARGIALTTSWCRAASSKITSR